MQPGTRSPEVTKPTLSIITVTYNAENHLEACINSVIGQRFTDLEIIIVDGGSTDRTITRVKSYGPKVNRLISEPDKGIYDAMNKGIRVANGEWIFFLGADDRMANDEVLETVFQNDFSEFSLINGQILRDDGKSPYHSRYDWQLLLRNTVSHQGTFYRRALFDDFIYDSRCKISADYELNLKAYLNQLPCKKLDLLIATCGSNGVSSKAKLIGYVEEIKIRNKYLPIYISIGLNILTYFRFVAKRCFQTAKSTIN